MALPYRVETCRASPPQLPDPPTGLISTMLILRRPHRQRQMLPVRFVAPPSDGMAGPVVQPATRPPAAASVASASVCPPHPTLLILTPRSSRLPAPHPPSTPRMPLRPPTIPPHLASASRTRNLPSPPFDPNCARSTPKPSPCPPNIGPPHRVSLQGSTFPLHLPTLAT